MNANAISIIALFEKKVLLEVPLFQRQYVWKKEQQWDPLWEDISRKFVEYLEGRKDAPIHFLGAMVLDQKQTPVTHVEKRQVIDGQQRLTTLQVFLAAFRDYCQYVECYDLAKECDTFILNAGMMADKETEQFKVRPTQLDRAPFADVMLSRSRAEVDKRHPLIRRKGARKFEPRERIVEAYFFFYDSISAFFSGTNGEQPQCSEHPISVRLEECFQALKNSLQVVAIDLEHGDDAQVIFETLNARGEPLLPADLLRNYIFLRAARQGFSQEELYGEYWRQFDEAFWRQEVRQGRLSRPRSDLFIQHFLASRQAYDIPIKHLFVEYKHWIEKQHPFETVRDELAALARQGTDFKRIIAPPVDDPMYPLAQFLEVFDVRTAYPLLLALLDAGISMDEIAAVSKILESYLLRRAVCQLTTQNYNRIFLQLIRTLRDKEWSAAEVEAGLARNTGESTVWPSDKAFRDAWMSTHAYKTLNNPKVVHILRSLNQTYLGTKMERLQINGTLSVEHILPQNWVEHWPLADGSKGITGADLWLKPELPACVATKRRNGLLQTFGNLTIVTQPLNASVSNNPWEKKRPELLNHSLLPINQHLQALPAWDEEAIEARGLELFERAIKIWPAPKEGSDR